MLPYFWYILKVIICSGILFGYYWLFLRNKLFHQYNRFYLLTAIVLSLLLPLLKIGFWQPQPERSQAIRILQAVSAGDEYMNHVIITSKAQNWSVQQLYPLAYWTVSFLFLLVLLQTLFAIRRLLRKYPARQIDDISFISTNDKSTPFSFLRFIFWNEGIDINSTTGSQIFKHEVTHIRERHTHDKLFVNILLILFWCNPFFWLYRKELNMIHEFIADKKAVEDNDTASFAAMILQATYPQHRFELANNFFYSPIKRRLLMLTKNNNPKVNYIGRIMVLPLAVLIFAAFTLKTKSADAKNDTHPAIYEDMTEASPLISDTIPSQAMFVNVKHADSAYLQSGEYKTKALVIIDSKEIGNLGCNYVNTANDTYSSVVVYAPAEAQKVYGEKGKYGAIKLTQKDITCITAKTVTYDAKEKSIKLTGPDVTIKGDLSTTLIYVDGKIASQEKLSEIPAEKISSINLIKGEKLEEVTEAKGKTAIIQVNLKPDDLQEVVVTGFPTTRPPVAIALDKMNVLYIGVDNPVTIAVPGIPSNQLIVNMDNGSITGNNGKYNVTVTQPGTATIRVATVKDDRKVLLSTQTFRVRLIPDPADDKLTIDYDAKFRTDSSRYLELKDQYNLMQENQLKLSQDLYPKTVTGKKLQEEQLVFLKQKLELLQKDKSRANAEQKLFLENKIKGLQQEYLKNDMRLQYDKILQEKTNQLLARQYKSALDQHLLTEIAEGQKMESLKQNLESLKQLNNKQVPDTTSYNLLLKEKELLQSRQNNLLFSKSEISPSFVGGYDAWKKYLEKNLNPTIPMNEGWKPGKYTVIVKFIVRTDGSVTDVQTENYKGTKTAQHCIDIIRNGPKWEPGMQNGKKVNAYRRQPITFVIQE